MPHLLNFLKGNGTLLTNDHTILISHTAGGILSSLTGLYPDRTGQTVSNSYDYYRANGTPTFTSSFKYWTDTVDGSDDSLPNMVGDGGQTAPAPWLTYTHAGCNVGGVSAANIELENNNVDRVHVARRRPRSSATTNDQGRRASPASRPARSITIDTGAATETATIASVGTAGATGTGVTLTAPADERARIGRSCVRHRPGRRHDAGLRPARPSGTRAATRSSLRPEPPRATLAQTDFVGYRDPLRAGRSRRARATRTRGRTTRRSSPARTTATSALFGAKYVDPAITERRNAVRQGDRRHHRHRRPVRPVRLPGLRRGAREEHARQVAAMQEHGVPVTYAYISDAHDNHTLGARVRAGRGGLPAAAGRLRRRVRTFFQRLEAATGSTRATRSSSSPSTRVTTSQAAPARPIRRTGRAHVHARAVQSPPLDDVPVEPDRRDHDEPEGARSGGSRRSTCTSTMHRRSTCNGQPTRTDPSVRQAGAGPREPPPPIDPYQGGAAVADSRERPRRPGRGEDAAHGQRRPEADADVHAVRERRLLLPGVELDDVRHADR